VKIRRRNLKNLLRKNKGDIMSTEKIRCELCHKYAEPVEVNFKDTPGTTITMYVCNKCWLKLVDVNAKDAGIE
jgi:DNA-directed RNA polymerase subunit RPC12/RpoP